MAKSAAPGELRTRIKILAPTNHADNEGYKNPSYANIYPGRVIRCKWTSAFGNEAVQAQSLGLTDTATLTMRYDPRITSDCVIVRVGDDPQKRVYELMSPPNDVGGEHRWLELRVKRRVRGL